MADEPYKDVGIRITSDPDTTDIEQPEKGGAKETPQLPLRLLLVSNLTPHASVTDWSDGSRVFRVDKHNFAERMRQMAPRLFLEVPNIISEAPKLLDVELGFSDLEAFQPVQVIQQVPALAQLLQIRSLVYAVKTKEIDLEVFQERLVEAGVDADWAAQLYQVISRPPRPRPSAPASSSGPSGGALDRLLGMISLGDEAPGEEAAPPSGTSGLVDSLMQAVTGEAEPKPGVEKAAADLLLTDLDGILSDQLNAILGHAGFRQLEAAWRGLKFLVDRINFRKNIELEVLAAPKEALDEALYFQVLLPEHNKEVTEPAISAVLLDFAFDNGHGDVKQLEDLAETGASLQAPLIASVSPAFFGIAEHSGLAKVPVLWQHLDRPEYIEWHKLREKKESRYLALALPPFVLRYPYGAEHPVKAFGFAEQGVLFGSSALAVGVRIADSFAETGWPTHVLGSSLERRLENFPVWKSPQGHLPLAALLPDSKVGEFNKAGFVVLGCKLNRDAVHVERAPTVCLPESYEDLMAATEARVHVTLASQLFVARAAHYVLALQGSLAPGDLEQVRQEIEAHMRAFLHTEGQVVPKEAIWIEHVADAGVEGHELFAIRLRPPSYALDREVSLLLGLQVPKPPAA